MYDKVIKVLLIEDDEDDYVMTRELLSEIDGSKFDLTWVATYQEALDAIKHHSHDVCLIDYSLGEHNGVELLYTSRARGYKSPVILLTGLADQNVDNKAMKAGASDYLVKDHINKALLERSIRYAIERNKTLEALRESENRYRRIVENTREGIWTLDAEARTNYVNPRMMQILGYAIEEMLGRSYFDFMDEEARNQAILLFKRRRQGLADQYEIQMRHRDGRSLWISVSGNPMFDESGEFIGSLGLMNDVTERRQMEEALRSEQEYISHIISAAPTIIVGITMDGTTTFVNKAVCGITGYEPEELVGKNWWEVLYPGDEARQVDQLFKEFEKGGVLDYEMALTTKQGERRYVSWNSVNRMGSDGEISHVIGIGVDITERLRAENALKQSELQFRAVFENTLDAMLIADDCGTYVDANPAACNLLDNSYDQLMGRSVGDFIEPGKNVETAQLWQSFLAAGSQQGIIRLQRPGGKYLDVDYSAKANFLPGRHLSVLRDITERRELEDRLRQAQKMEAIGHLAGGVAHDFNNLLTAINGYADLALRRADNELLRGQLGEIKKAGERAASLTRQLLAFSRKQVLQPKVLNLNDVVIDTIKMLHRLIGEDIEISTALSVDIGQVKADPGQIEQVLMNLLVNAKDAMPTGGRITIRTENLEMNEEIARKYVSVRSGAHIRLTVSDTGCGMDSETRSHIFEPFFTTKQLGKGTGLGLSTVYGIVKQSDGYISVYSEEGCGTTFKIYLPRVDEAVKAKELIQAEVPHGDETVLLVEDDELVRKIAHTILEQCGYTVLETSNGRDALRICREHAGRISMMLTDVVMPLMNGRDLANQVAELQPDMKVLYMSGYTDDVIVHHGVLEDGASFLEKPFTPEALARKVREVIDALI